MGLAVEVNGLDHRGHNDCCARASRGSTRGRASRTHGTRRARGRFSSLAHLDTLRGRRSRRRARRMGGTREMRHASGDTARWRQSRAVRTTCGEDRRGGVVGLCAESSPWRPWTRQRATCPARWRGACRTGFPAWATPSWCAASWYDGSAGTNASGPRSARHGQITARIRGHESAVHIHRSRATRRVLWGARRRGTAYRVCFGRENLLWCTRDSRRTPRRRTRDETTPAGA